MKKTFKIGDTVKTTLKDLGNSRNIKVTGTVKEIRQDGGFKTYIVTGGTAEDFPTRRITK